MTAPTPDPFKTLAEVICAAICGADQPRAIPSADSPRHRVAACYAHQSAATAVLAAIDSGQVPGVGRVEAADAEALREAKGDIKARIETFRGLDAHPEYMNALNDAWGLVANRERAALAAAPAPQQVDTEVERAAASALRAAIQSEIDSAYRVGANYVLCSRLRSALSTSASGVVVPAAEPVALTEEQHAELATDGSLVANGVVYVEASSDPRDLPVLAYQNVQWLHLQGDESGLLSRVAALWRDAYDIGARDNAEQAELNVEKDAIAEAVRRMREDAERCGDSVGSFMPAVADWLNVVARRWPTGRSRVTRERAIALTVARAYLSDVVTPPDQTGGDR